jgi:cell shape-determining protein MreC
LFKEIANKSEVLRENNELKRIMSTYDQLRAENKDLKDQLSRMEAETGIGVAKDKKLSLVKVVGAQNMFTSKPEVLVYLNSNNNVKAWDPVYYESNTLFGFVKEINGKTAKVVPFYSPDISFNIPVQSLRDPSQKGFVSNIAGGKVTIRNVSKEVGVSVGDIWVTTNDVADVPSTLVVGKVSNVVKNDKENFQIVELDLPFNLDATTYLMIGDN